MKPWMAPEALLRLASMLLVRDSISSMASDRLKVRWHSGSSELQQVSESDRSEWELPGFCSSAFRRTKLHALLAW